MTTERSNEPVLARTALRPFVQAAQSQPIQATRLSAHEVQRAWAQAQHEQQRTRRALAIGVVLGVAAAAVVGIVTTSLLGHDVSRDHGALAIHDQLDELIELVEPDEWVEPDESLTLPANPLDRLDPSIRIRSDHAAEPPRVLGPWSIALDTGSHELMVQPIADRALRIELPERTLELVHGSMSIELVAGAPHAAVVRLESGIAAWIEADGTRVQIEVERIELPGEPTLEPVVSEPSAAELAREAERKLIAGQRDEAIGLLRKLVRKYPKAPQARTALMDLAAQERMAGDADRARCAYQLYLERWPHSEVRAEIDKQIAKLGEGPSCRGLDPR
jgi:hypothetical protein